MKKIASILAVAAAMALLGACSEKFEPVKPVQDGISFTISAPEAAPALRSVVGADGKTAWKAGDIIAITDGISTKNVTLAEGDIKPDGSASFSVDLTASGAYKAIYPAAALNEFGAEAIVSNYPAAVQSGSVDNGAHLAVAASATTSLSFKNVATLLSFTLTKTNVKSIKFKGNNEEEIAAVCSINPATGVAAVQSGAVKEVTVTVDHAATNYISILPTNFTKGFTITFLDEGGESLGSVAPETAIDAAIGKLVNLGSLDAKVPGGGGEAVTREDFYGAVFTPSGTDKSEDSELTYTSESGVTIHQYWIANTNYVNQACKTIHTKSYNTCLRLYGGHRLQFTGKTFTKIEFVCGPWEGGHDETTYNIPADKITIVEGGGTYTVDGDYTAHWEGEATEVILHYSKQARISGLFISYK